MTALAVSSESKRLSGLDHLRALAIIMVLFYHYRMFAHPEWVDTVMGFGWTGVDLFFVLSGFLIAAPLLERMAKGKPISLPEFFIKRFFRIIPPYLVVLAIYFLIPAFRERESLPPLWKLLTFTQNLGLDLKTKGTFSHVWSLCVEEHFYLFFPLVLAAMIAFRATKKGWLVLAGLFILGFLVRLYCWHYLIAPGLGTDDFWRVWYQHMYYPTYNRLDGLLAGVSIAALWAFRPALKERITKYGNALAGISILVLTGAWFLCEQQTSFSASIFGFPVIALGYGCMIMAALSPSCFLYRFNSRITAFIAKMSFVLYLSHKGIIHLVQPLFEKTGLESKGNMMLLASMLAALAGAFILHQIVEVPFLRLRQRVLSKRKLSKTPVAAAL